MHRLAPHILVQGTADWNQAIATNQHYMVRELSRQFRITYVESLGLRRPEINSRDLRRVLHRLRPGRTRSSSQRPIPTGVQIVSPKIVPIHRGLWLSLNRALMTRALRNWMGTPATRVHWTYSPVTYEFNTFADVSVYHCVDLYAEFPGIDRDLILRSEQRLARLGALAIGSSEVVVAHLKRQGFSTVLFWPNVADVDRIKMARNRTSQAKRSGAVFAGNLSDKKVDFALLRHLVEKGIELHLAGPVAEGGGASQAEVNALIAAGAVYHGVLGFDQLAALLHYCKVGLIPYQLNDYTMGVNPLKTFEYLAAGLAVVSTPIPSVAPLPGDVTITSSHEEFGLSVDQRMAEVRDTDVNRRIAIADVHSWRERGEWARKLVEEICERVSGVT